MLQCTFAKNWSQARCVATSRRLDAKPTLASKKFKSRPLLAKLDADGKVSEIYVKSKGPSLAQRLSGDYAERKRLGRQASVELLRNKLDKLSHGSRFMTYGSYEEVNRLKAALSDIDQHQMNGKLFSKLFQACESFTPRFMDPKPLKKDVEVSLDDLIALAGAI